MSGRIEQREDGRWGVVRAKQYVKTWAEEPTVDPTAPRAYVDELGTGSSFIWADRRVTVSHFEANDSRAARRSRWLHVTEDDGTPHRLSYYLDEIVTLAGVPSPEGER